MAKLTLNNVTNLLDYATAQTTINNNWDAIEAAVEKTLSRDGTSPNQMTNTLDMNSKRIINLPTPIGVSEPLRLQDLADFISEGVVHAVPAGGATGNTLTKVSAADYDVAWSSAGAGDVSGPSSAVDSNLVAFNTTTGKLLKDSGKAYPTGVIVGTTDSQTLTNKTLTSPVVNSPTGIVKADVGLGNVDNTSDATKNAAAVTLTNKTITAPVISTIVNTGTLTLPTSTDTLVGRATTDTLTNKTLTSPVISTISNTGVLTLPTSTDTLVGRATTDTLTNKTLTSPVINTPTGISKSDVGLGNVDNTSDATKNAAAVTLTNKTLTSPIISTISNVGTLTLPTSTDTLVGRNTTDTLTNKTLTSPVINTPTGISKSDVGLGNVDNTSDATKNAAAVTLTNKTLTAPVISTITNTGTITLPTSTDTLVGRATTDTLTNKTISGASNTITDVSLATGVTGNLPVTNLNGGTGASSTTYWRGDGVWFTPSGGGSGSPGGSSTHVQYNNAGAFEGNAGFTYDGTSAITLGVAGTSVGKVGLTNATSGSTTLQPATGALGTGVVTVPTGTYNLVGDTTTQTLTNKTLTSPTMTTPTLGVASATSINKVAVTAPATSATLTIPDGVTFTGPASSGTAMTLGNAETVTGVKTFGSAGAVSKLKIAGSTSGSTTLDTSAVAGTAVVTIPAVTDTLVGKATTDTLTNKTISGSSNTITNVSLSSGVTGNLPVTNLNSGTGASSSTYWRGDGTWAAAGGSGGFVSSNYYSSTQTITIPTGATKANIRLWGASGGSGGSLTDVGTGGGGGGGALIKSLTGLTAGNTLSLTVGAAGAGGATTTTDGGNGGNSTLASGTQSITTLTANGGSGSVANLYTDPSQGGAGGTASNGDINITGQRGSTSASTGSGSGKPGSGGSTGLAMSFGGEGAANSAGNAGVAGGCFIEWFS